MRPTGRPTLKAASVGILAVVAAASLAGCARDGGLTPTAESSPMPTQTATSTAQPPTPTSTAAAPASPTPTVAAAILIEIPDCVPSDPPSNSGSSGTAPLPRPTPTPGTEGLSASELQDAVASFLATASEVERRSESLGLFLGELTQTVESPERAAEILKVAGARNEVLCRAWRLVQRPAGSELASQAIESALVATQDSLKAAASALSMGGDFESRPWVDTAALPPSLLELGEVQELAERFDIALPLQGRDWTVDPTLLGLRLQAPAGTLLIRDDTQVVLLGPETYQDALSLGPAQWGVGTGTRITRIRNGEDWDTEQAIAIGAVLLSLAGEPVAVGDVSTADGTPGIRHAVELGEQRWTYLVDVVIAEEFTYFFQTGCPSSLFSCGELADQLLGGATIGP